MLKKAAVRGVAALVCLVPLGVAQTLPIPSQYQDAYNTVNANVTSFSATVNANWGGAVSPVVYAPQLQTATSALTTSLLQPNYYQVTVLAELNSLQALGVTGVTFHIDFPTLYQPFYSNPADYQAYLSFYTTLVNEIHARGLKVVIENTISLVYPGTNGASFIPYYQSLDWPTYMSQRAQLAASIAQLLQPDYIVLVAEPDTEANASGQVNANTVSGSTQMVQGMIASIRATGATGVQMGAGCGTWHPSFLQFIQSFTTLPLNQIDMHVYPVNVNNLPNALNALGLVQAAGKQASMSEFWAYKESDAEYNQVLPYTTVYARDVFSFWESTDIAFLQAMKNFANFGKFAFLSPFWSHNFAADLDYAVYGGQPDATVITTESAAATAANMAGAFTATGLAWENMMIPAPDVTPPLVPAPPSLQGVSQTQAVVVWTKTSDNVGVAAYNVYRNGVQVGTVNTPPTFYDSGLTPQTSYSYTVAAFDAAGNLSPQSAPLSVATLGYPDTTPPTVPSGIRAAALSDLQISLAWTASVDNVAVSGYEIYRGTSTSTIVPFSSTSANSYLDLQVVPGTTYYYQIDAFDTTGNHSARSAIFSSKTLPDTMPPTTPANVAAVAQTGPSTVITWSSSTDDYQVGSYQIYRGLSPTNLLLIGGVPASTLTFSDMHPSLGKTYYYTVVALDIARNASPMSSPVTVTFAPQAPPSVPTGIRLSPTDVQISLTWTASTDNVPVVGYEIYRGTSPTSITALGTSPVPSFTDLQVSPSTTYYYQIDSYDGSNSTHSARSAIVTATTLPDTTPPTTPTNVSVVVQAGPLATITWNASTDNYRVGSYKVYRGTSSTSLNVVGGVAATALTYADTHITSGKTYYYSVAAVDVAGNVSVMSSPVMVTAP